jgi:hypothetical protein
MRLTLALLGFTLDLSLEPTAADEPDAAALNGGTLASTEMAVGFTSKWLGETGIEMYPPDDRGST